MEIGRRARFAPGVVRYLREPLDVDGALAMVAARVAAREDRFLALAGGAVFDDPVSPHRRLLEAAGWDLPRLRAGVGRDGLERTLEALRDNGVWTSLEEFRGLTAIRRGDLVIEPARSAFVNTLQRGRGLAGSTSGTSARPPARVAYGWGFLREEAALECALLAVHGLLDAPCAFWLPALPAVSGAHNMLVHLGFRRPPERWFSQLAVRRRNAPEYLGLRAAARPFGLRLPHPEETPPAGAERIARWLAEARDRSGRAVLKTFASSAVRVADAARRLGIELRGCTIFAGGEPLTERRRRFLSASGAAVFGRYVATETGWLGGACPLSPSPDALHLYTDLVAAVPSEGRLLFTTISPNAGNVLLNTDIGDAGTLRRRRCECLLGRAGLEVEVADVHGDSKVSAAGMTVPLRAVAAVLERLVEEAGGAPDSFRLEQHEREVGELRLVVVLARSVPLEDDRLAGALLERLPAQGPDAALAARAWRESGTIVVRRADPPPLKSTTR